MNVVLPAPLTPTINITNGLLSVVRSDGSAFPALSASSIPLLSAVLNSALVRTDPRCAWRDIPSTSRSVTGTPKSDCEQDLLDLLEGTLVDAAAREDRDVGKRDILDFLPKRASGDVALFAGKKCHPGWSPVAAMRAGCRFGIAPGAMIREGMRALNGVIYLEEATGCAIEPCLAHSFQRG